MERPRVRRPEWIEVLSAARGRGALLASCAANQTDACALRARGPRGASDRGDPRPALA